MQGERNIKLGFDDTTVIFDEISTIQFYKDEELILQLQPTDLSLLYSAYRQMAIEVLEDKKIT